MKKIKHYISDFFTFGLFIPLCASLVMLAVMLSGTDSIYIDLLAGIIAYIILYFLLRKKIDIHVIIIQFIELLIPLVVFTVTMLISHGNMSGSIVMNTLFTTVEFFPAYLIMLVYDMAGIYLLSGGLLITGLVLSIIFNGKPYFRKGILAGLAGIVILSSISAYSYFTGYEVDHIKQGYGFNYMHGYSTTDFGDYFVYSEPGKLVMLDHKPDVYIKDIQDMPVMDGAEACFPLYSSIAKNCYQDIGKIEKEYATNNDDKYYYVHNGKIVTFTNTIRAFERLIDGEVDLFFGARPSKNQMEYAKDENVEIEVTPIGKEAFVFFVEKDNPIDSLTSEQIRAIYHGDITNWKEVGGKDGKIIAFQRPVNSGSQTMMEYFMKDISLKEPQTYEYVGGMGEVVQQVVTYQNKAGAIGYTFRYFLEDLNQEKNVKMVKVDGVYPSNENIQNGTYPLTTSLCLVTRKENKNENVERMKEFILSEDGQSIIEQTGYSPLN